MLDLAYQSLAILVALGGLILLYWSMFRDRARGRRRCPKCWYDLRGTESLTCPECGHHATSEQELLRTRRHWNWASASMLILVVGSWMVPRMVRDGWMSVTPTPVLIAILPHAGSEGVGEIRHRWAGKDFQYTGQGDLDPWVVRFAHWQAARSLGSGHDLAMRQAMADLLLWLNDREPLGDAVLDWLSDSDPQVRAAGISLVSHVNLEPVGGSAIASKLCSLMGDSNASVSMYAAGALGRFVNDDPAIVESLVLGLQDSSSGVHRYSATALYNLNDASPAVLEGLGQLILSNDKAAARAAITLGKIGDSSVVPALVHGIGNRDGWVRESCARSLLQLGKIVQSEAVAGSLAAILDHDNPGVRAAAVAALLGQGSFAEPHVQRMLTAIDALNVEELMQCVRPPLQWDGAIAVPVLVAVAGCCIETVDTDTSLHSLAAEAITMMREYPDQCGQMTPFLRDLLASPYDWLRENAAVTLGCFGEHSRITLPTLRRMHEHAATDREKRILGEVIDSIENEIPSR